MAYSDSRQSKIMMDNDGKMNIYADGEALEVAVVEFSPEWENPSANMAALDRIFDALFSSGEYPAPDLVVLPEFFAAGFTMNPGAAEDAAASPTLAWMESTVAHFRCALAGSVPVREAGKRYNRLFFVQPVTSCAGTDGSVSVSWYDKAHLFFGGEDSNYTPGESRKVFVHKGWKILPGICFDLRFPEWARNTGDSPYDLYLNVANWPSARNAAADILVKARSIENVCWSVFCNRTGHDTLLEYSGRSAVIDYRGRSRGDRVCICGSPVLRARLEKAPMYRFRENFPILDRIK